MQHMGSYQPPPTAACVLLGLMLTGPTAVCSLCSAAAEHPTLAVVIASNSNAIGSNPNHNSGRPLAHDTGQSAGPAAKQC